MKYSTKKNQVENVDCWFTSHTKGNLYFAESIRRLGIMEELVGLWETHSLNLCTRLENDN